MRKICQTLSTELLPWILQTVSADLKTVRKIPQTVSAQLEIPRIRATMLPVFRRRQIRSTLSNGVCHRIFRSVSGNSETVSRKSPRCRKASEVLFPISETVSPKSPVSHRRYKRGACSQGYQPKNPFHSAH